MSDQEWFGVYRSPLKIAQMKEENAALSRFLRSMHSKVNDKSALLPCPFCGGSKVSFSNIRDGVEVFCHNVVSCGASMPAFNPRAREKATIAWNTRPAVPPVATVGELLVRAESARTRMTAMCAAGMELPDEAEFGAIEAEWIAARDAVRQAVEDALGVSAQRIAEIVC